MSHSTAAQKEAIARFWTAFAVLEELGIRANHHRHAGYLALHLGAIGKLFDQHGIEPVCVEGGLRAALIHSQNPRYIGEWDTKSAISGSPVRCMVFKTEGVAQ